MKEKRPLFAPIHPADDCDLCGETAVLNRYELIMIASLSGSILKIEGSSLVIGVGGVGVRMFVPRTVLESIGG